MKILYEEHKFRPDALTAIEQANEIIEEYQQDSIELSLWQLYYRHVARGLIENTERSYKKLGDLISNARMAGLVDWDAIVDRTRNLRKNPSWETPADIVEVCAQQFAVDKWAPQPYYVECWVEKDALVGVIGSTCEPLDVPYFSCRGYTSQSEMWIAGQRILRKLIAGKKVLVLHLGDHDPSGKDMTRDITERLQTFLAVDLLRDYRTKNGGSKWNKDEAIAWTASKMDNFEVRRIALTIEQVRQYNPPPNPAKLTDTRAEKYIAEFGGESWELDALEPRTLAALITDNIETVRDDTLWNKETEKERQGRSLLQEVSDQWPDVSLYVARKD